jgi:hypothetical protein
MLPLAVILGFAIPPQTARRPHLLQLSSEHWEVCQTIYQVAIQDSAAAERPYLLHPRPTAAVMAVVRQIMLARVAVAQLARVEPASRGAMII